MAYRPYLGIGLLEMMLALCLSITLLGVIFRYADFLDHSLFIASGKVEKMEIGNVMLAWIAHDVEMAGNMGCLNSQLRQNIDDPHGYLLKTWLNVTPDGLDAQYMSSKRYNVLDNTNGQLLIQGDNEFKVDDVVVVENCWQASIAKITKISSVDYGEKNRLSFDTTISMANNNAVYVGKLIQHHYYTKQGSNVLYVKELDGKEESIIDNLERISFSQEVDHINVDVITSIDQESLHFLMKYYNESF